MAAVAAEAEDTGGSVEAAEAFMAADSTADSVPIWVDGIPGVTMAAVAASVA